MMQFFYQYLKRIKIINLIQKYDYSFFIFIFKYLILGFSRQLNLFSSKFGFIAADVRVFYSHPILLLCSE